MAFCTQCGHELIENAKFCSNCGAPNPRAVTENPPSEPEKASEQVNTAEQGSYSSYTNEPKVYDGYSSPGQTTQSNSQEYKAPEREYNTWRSAAAAIEEPVKKSGGAGPVIGIIVGVLIIAAALAWIFLGGKTGGGGNDFAGYWKCVSARLGGVDMADVVGGVVDIEDMYGIMLNDDNTFEMEILGEDDLITGTWKSVKDGISMTADGDTIRLAFADDQLIMDLSEDGDEFVAYFERGGSTAPSDFGKSIWNDTSSDDVNEPSAAGTPRPSYGGETVSREFEYFDIEILGGEPAEDEYDKNCFRIYYRFTNTSDTTLAAYWETESKACQNGEELESVYLLSDVEEDDCDYLYVMPDTSIICTVCYKLVNDSPLELYMYDSYGDADDCAVMTFNVTENTGGFRNDFALVSNPQWTNSMPGSRVWDDLSCTIMGAELTESIFGEEIVKVDIEFTNNSAEAAEIYDLASIEIYQDDVEMDSGYLGSDVNDQFYELAPGETVTISAAGVLRSDSPIVVLVYNWDSDEYIGDTFKLD